jgi:hypothetical protein
MIFAEEVWLGRATPLKRMGIFAKMRHSIIQRRRSHLFMRFAEQAPRDDEKTIGRYGRVLPGYKAKRIQKFKNRVPKAESPIAA